MHHYLQGAGHGSIVFEEECRNRTLRNIGMIIEQSHKNYEENKKNKYINLNDKNEKNANIFIKEDLIK